MSNIVIGAPWLAARRLAALAGVWLRMRNPFGTSPFDRAQALQALTAEICRKIGVAIEVIGTAPPPGPCVVVANHVSWVDTVVMPSLVHGTCVAKCEVARWPLIGPLTERLGILFVDRGCPWSGAVVLRRALRALECGLAVAAFPEGTTTSGDELLPFRRGIFGVARRLGVPVITAAVRYEDPRLAWVGDADFLGHFLRRVASRPATPVRVTFGDPIDPRSYGSAEALAAAARAQIGRVLARPRTERGAGVALSHSLRTPVTL